MPQHTITGEAVVLNLRAANFMPRLGAALLDAVVYFLVWIAGLIGFASTTTMLTFDPAAAQTAILISAITLMFLLPLAVEGLTSGRSLGKLVFGLKVVRDDGGTIRWRHAFIRSLTGVFELWMAFGSVAILASLFNRQSKRLGDMMAGTYVIMVRPRKLPDPLPAVPSAMQHWASVADVGRIPQGLATQVMTLIRNAPTMTPHALDALASQLQHQILNYVSPGPPPSVDALTFLVGVMAERRDRDYAVLVRRRERRQRHQQYFMR